MRRKLERLQAEPAQIQAELAAVPAAPPSVDWTLVWAEAEAL